MAPNRCTPQRVAVNARGPDGRAVSPVGSGVDIKRRKLTDTNSAISAVFADSSMAQSALWPRAAPRIRPKPPMAAVIAIGRREAVRKSGHRSIPAAQLRRPAGHLGTAPTRADRPAVYTATSSSQPLTDRRSSIPDVSPRPTRYPHMWDAQLATLMLFDTNKDNMACQ